MRVLVTWGSKLGGTEGIARTVGDELRRDGLDVVLAPASEVRSLDGYDAAIVGGALYANRWHRAAHHLVTRHAGALRRMPVWLFSSGPLDDSADEKDIPPTREVSALMQSVGALGHRTFGGRLPEDARGFPAAAMAKTMSGDWRNTERIRIWAAELARRIPTAMPGPVVEPEGHSPTRLAAYGLAGWALLAIAMLGLTPLVSAGFAVTIHFILAPLVFAALAASYFKAPGAWEPMPTAGIFTAIVVALDALLLAWLSTEGFALFANVWATWVPYVLIFVATWMTGSITAMMPTPEQRADWSKTPKAA